MFYCYYAADNRKPEIKEEGPTLISRGIRARPLFDPEILRRAIRQSFVKLNPRMVGKETR